MPENTSPERYLSKKELLEFCGITDTTLARRGEPAPDVILGDIRGWTRATAQEHKDYWATRGPGRPRKKTR
ncbi:hypothetical protein [Curtobacterium sp. S6]|uniref:hypothetical protein n=1 Tax=Curtobacterium sp. S6 TaxID=1479623 RepID=UPI0004AB6A25|nr:hypothetical protein [Curtobacterium sp. S6]